MKRPAEQHTHAVRTPKSLGVTKPSPFRIESADNGACTHHLCEYYIGAALLLNTRIALERIDLESIICAGDDVVLTGRHRNSFIDGIINA